MKKAARYEEKLMLTSYFCCCNPMETHVQSIISIEEGVYRHTAVPARLETAWMGVQNSYTFVVGMYPL